MSVLDDIIATDEHDWCPLFFLANAEEDNVFTADEFGNPKDSGVKLNDADIAAHAVLTTGVHGVGTGTIASISTANKTIYVDQNAVGVGDGTSWADAFTSPQNAVDSLEDLIIHTYTIKMRSETKKTGTADENTANHLVDDANSQFTADDVGKRVYNITDGGWGVIGSYIDAGDVGIVDEDGNNLDLFPDGDEDYVIEGTPYRETIYLNSAPASYPSHLILGQIIIEAEYYWYDACEANVNAGEIKDTGQDWTGIEVGDKVCVIDFNGANDRAQDYEVGTVNDLSQVGAGIIGTDLTKTPTTGWKYTIVKTEISGSDDGTDPGTARDYNFYINKMDKVTIYGFLHTLTDNSVLYIDGCGIINFYGNYLENCDGAVTIINQSDLTAYYNYYHTDNNRSQFYIQSSSFVNNRYCAHDHDSTTIFYIISNSFCRAWYCILDDGGRGVEVLEFAGAYFYRGTITNGVTTGFYVRNNSIIKGLQYTNNAATPEDPVGTVEGAYIG